MAGLSPWAWAVLGEWVPRKVEKQDRTAAAGSKTATHCQLQRQRNTPPHPSFNMEQSDSRLCPHCQDVKQFSFKLQNMISTTLLLKCLSWTQPPDCAWSQLQKLTAQERQIHSRRLSGLRSVSSSWIWSPTILMVRDPILTSCPPPPHMHHGIAVMPYA